MKNLSVLKNRIKKNEGYREEAYFDVLGFLTIGYGHLIKKNELFFLKGKHAKTILDNLFEKDFSKALKHYNKFYKNNKHTYNTREVYIEMIFQLGIKNQKKFIKMNNYVNKNKLFMAAFEMKKSLWYNQTPKRVNFLTRLLLINEYEKKR